MEELAQLIPFLILIIVVVIAITTALKHQRFVARMRQAFKNKDGSVREEVIQEVHGYLHRATDGRLISLLLEALRDKDERVRLSTVRAFEDRIDAKVQSGNSSRPVISDFMKPAVVNALIWALKDETPSVRRNAAAALGKVKESVPVGALIEALSDPDKDVCHKAILALKKLGYIRAVPPLLKLLEGEHRYIAMEALETLCENVKQMKFGEKMRNVHDYAHTLYDPNLAHLTVTMSKLREIVIYTASCNLQQIEALAQYMAKFLDEDQIRKRIKTYIYGNVSQFSADVSRVFSQCKHIEVDTEVVIFGGKRPAGFYSQAAWQNPDCSVLALPLSHLQQIIVYTESYDFHQLERFLTYAVNYIGQKHLEKEVDVHIYGDPEQLDQNLRNNLTNFCRSVTVH